MNRRSPLLVQILSLSVLLVLTGCGTDTTHVVAPDMEPVGSGLRFLGVALVVMALVTVLDPFSGG